MKRSLLVLAGLAALLATATYSSAIDADPKKDYPVKPETGAYLICAASYTGPEAPQLARELAYEIRSRYGLPAYVFNRSDEERRRQKEERDRLQQMYPQADLSKLRRVRIQEQCVVLVGGYKDMETARKALDDIKKLKLTKERLMPFVFSGSGGDSGKATDKNSKTDVQGAFVSPFVDSFVVPNPTVKRDRAPDPKQDKFLKELNAGEDYSLLRCKQPWTLMVAVFHGTSVIQSQAAAPTFLDKILGRDTGEALAASGLNAHNFAEALRKIGFDAYVLHTRQSSIVTVGGFSAKDDPRIKQVQQALYSSLQMGKEVQMLPNPVPIEVPQL